MKRFDIVTALIVLAGKIQERRVKRAQAKVKAIIATINAASAALPEAQREATKARTKTHSIALAK